ncbi:hypothetical protein CERSUDRAFT_147732 [Gelatoporia subvermispora B]|uniref:F-box domain-containing protein n=1 Tax=Ceriporiopsis subvermispora (strain B) TaxID=914234 RepID=M2RT81_CERS8|nr:hypothetical protein CERSUDRAFT_147732 [Gelatoporia subvermispora B]
MSTIAMSRTRPIIKWDSGLLFRLPDELLVQVLEELDFRTLARCRQVCKLLLTIINGAAALQYKIELGVAGMENGPSRAPFGTADRLARLKKHQQAWDALQSHEPIRWISMEERGVWELYGNVLAQAKDPTTLCFQQLPSIIRGIDSKEWTLENFDFVIRDFGMDPAQDLLVLVQSPHASIHEPYRIHLRHLSSGERHSIASTNAILIHSSRTDNYSFTTIQVSGDLLGILFADPVEDDVQLIVWNWTTGTRICRVIDEDIGSFAFLTSRHVLLALAGPDYDEDVLGPVLFVIDVFQHAGTGTDTLLQSDYLCKFSLPQLSEQVIHYSVLIRSDPAPAWKPHPDLKVPFYTARHERLLVLTLNVIEETRRFRSFLLLVPSSTLTYRIDAGASASDRRVFQWEDWGPTGTRLIRAPAQHTRVWVCHVFGMKFAFKHIANDKTEICIMDFNWLPVMRQKAEDSDDLELNLKDQMTTIRSGRIFENPVSTSLPYRSRSIVLDLPSGEGPIPLTAVMLSEDSLIMVADMPGIRKFGIITY